MRQILAFALATTMLLPSCATLSPEAKVRQRLIEAGLRPSMAGCVAERLVDRLSYGELRQLGRLTKLPQRDVGQMTISDLLGRLRALGNPHIVEVVTRAGVGCMIAG